MVPGNTRRLESGASLFFCMVDLTKVMKKANFFVPRGQLFVCLAVFLTFTIRYVSVSVPNVSRIQNWTYEIRRGLAAQSIVPKFAAVKDFQEQHIFRFPRISSYSLVDVVKQQ